MLLTGATGTVGSYILARLLQHADVSMVFCPVRGENPTLRLQRSLQDRDLSLSRFEKVIVLPSDLSQPELGLSPQEYGTIIANLTHTIHCAWPVNFKISLQSFEPHITGVRNLLQLSLAAQQYRPTYFVFCSSITVTTGSPAHTKIPEGPIRDLSHCSGLGYGRSKLVAELIVQAAVDKAGANATILRIGQVIGDQRSGFWNEREMIPMIIRSGLRMCALPRLSMNCQWLPVDTLADTILDITSINAAAAIQSTRGKIAWFSPATGDPISYARSPVGLEAMRGELVYNVCSPHSFSWTSEFLPTLSNAGFKFQTIPYDDWIARLRTTSFSTSSRSSSRSADSGLTVEPVVKLLEYLQSGFLDDSKQAFGLRDRASQRDFINAKERSQSYRGRTRDIDG